MAARAASRAAPRLRGRMSGWLRQPVWDAMCVVGLGAVRGRLEATLEAVLEAVPRGRCKTCVFPTVAWLKRFFIKKPF